MSNCFGNSWTKCLKLQWDWVNNSLTRWQRSDFFNYYNKSKNKTPNENKVLYLTYDISNITRVNVAEIILPGSVLKVVLIFLAYILGQIWVEKISEKCFVGHFILKWTELPVFFAWRAIQLRKEIVKELTLETWFNRRVFF